MMKHSWQALGLAVGLTVSGLTLAGCKAKPALTDDALASSIQTQLASDSAIAGQQVAVTVLNGVATLNGAVANEAQRTIAARDAAGVAGVKEVVNSLVTGTPSTTAMTAPPPPVPVPEAAPVTTPVPVSPVVLPTKPSAGKLVDRKEHDRDLRNAAAPIERNPPPQQQALNQPAPPEPKPVAPQPPTFRTVTIQAGESIPVRITQTLDSGTTQQGTSFSGVVASDIVEDGLVAVPAGANVSGQVDAVHEAGHFAGASLLTVSLNTLSRHGDRMSVSTEPYTVTGKGRGKNTLEKSGIGAAGGAILGGIFGGGKGAAIGAGVGGAGGAGVNGVTKAQQVQIASESVVRFRLTSPISVKVRTDGGSHDNGDQGLQNH